LDFGRAFSYGYSFLTSSDSEVLLTYIKNEIGWDNIPLIYINDSNRFSGSKREDVVPLGDGAIGFHGYRNILINFLVEFHRNNKSEKGGLL
jgi:deoxyribonuclease IV